MNMTRSTHPFDREEVMAYLDGELSPALAAAAAAHLEQCGECRALAAELRGVSKQMLAWQVEESPAGMAEGVLAAAKVAAEKPEAGKSAPVFSLKPTRGRFRLLMYGLTAFATLLLLIAISVPNLLRSRMASDKAMRMARERQWATRAPEAPMGDLSRDALNKESRGDGDERSAAALSGRAAAAPGGGGTGTQNYEIEGIAGPMIVRSASLAVVVKDFDQGRAALDALLRTHHGYAANLTVSTPQNAGRSLTATLQVPSDQIDAVLAELKKLGRVEQESQAAEEVTRQYVDLTARLKNSRETEQRLIEVLRERTGKVKDVLEVEQEIARVRGEIEQMDAERKNLERQVRFAALQLKLAEEYKAALEQPQPSAATRLGNAIVEGVRDAIESAISFLVFLLSVAPWMALWTMLLFWPVRFAYRKVRAMAA
jgi:Domain of unknown function (DUF4349)/Putative zinc-finger